GSSFTNGGATSSTSSGVSSTSSATATSTANTSSSTGAGGDGGGDPCGAGFECVPEATGGEYVRVHTGASAACPPGWSSPTAYGDGADPGCDPCVCSTPSGTTCVVGIYTAYSQGCFSQFGSPLDADTGCYDIFVDGIPGAIVTPSTPVGGVC